MLSRETIYPNYLPADCNPLHGQLYHVLADKPALIQSAGNRIPLMMFTIKDLTKYSFSH